MPPKRKQPPTTTTEPDSQPPTTTRPATRHTPAFSASSPSATTRPHSHVPVPQHPAPNNPKKSRTRAAGRSPAQSRNSAPGGGSIALDDRMRTSDLVAPEITYHVPHAHQPPGNFSSLVRPHGPSAQPPPRPGTTRPPPPVVTPVPPPKPLTLAPGTTSADRPIQPPQRADRNIDKVVLGDLCFRTWYPSYYGKELLGDLGGSSSGNSGAGKGAIAEDGGKAPSRRDREHHHQPVLERLYVCPGCFKYSKELVAWWGHVRVCERKREVPGRKVYVHPQGRRKVLIPQGGGPKGMGPKRKRGDSGVRYVEQTIQDEGEWSIWEADGENERLFCQNLSLFAKLFLDNKSVFFDVTGFNYFLLVYTPPHATLPGGVRDHMAEPPRAQIVGFFSKEKMSWDNNNLACILIFPPWQRKGLGSMLMGASYEISRREGILGGPEKPISDLGRRSYKRFWAGEIARWLLSLEADGPGESESGGGGGSPPGEVMVDVKDCSEATWISPEDCLSVLRDMGIVEDAGVGPGKPAELETKGGGETGVVEGRASAEPGAAAGQGDASSAAELPPAKEVRRVKIDKEAVRQYVASQRLNLERTCDAEGFVEGYAIKAAKREEEGDNMEE